MRAKRMGLLATCLVILIAQRALGQSAADILTRFRPSLKGVEYDAPATQAEIDACKLERVTGSKGEVIGFAVRDGQGKLLRRFIDTNGVATQRDGEARPQTHLDQWSYYRDGFEVYREIDLNEDGSLDEVRWLNAGGTRVGEVKAGRVVAWSRISAEEASKVLVQALVTGDMALLETVMATPAEIKGLALPEELSRNAAESASRRATDVKALLERLKGWDSETAWSRFDGMMPHVIPSDALGSGASEVILYENAVIFVTPSTKVDPRVVSYLHVPEVVRIGNTWKFLSLPRPVDPTQAVVADVEQGSLRSAVYGRTEVASASGEASTVPPELMDKLAQHDASMPGADATAKELAQWHLSRIELLRGIIAAAKSEEEKLSFYKQVIHDLAEAYKSGLYPQGAQVFDRLVAQGGKVGTFAAYRKILAEFDLEADKPGADLMKVQDETLKKLEAFLEKNPKSDEEPDVLFQIANVHMFNGNEQEARTFFARLAQAFPTADVGKKAAGAIRRLDSDGRKLTISGPTLAGGTASTADYAGKSVLVLFWMSAAEPDRREINDLLEVHRKYKDKGFEVLSVNLDYERALLDDYLRSISVPWPIIFEGGGLDSRLANEYGIITTPTMFLLDAEGKVVTHRVNKASEVGKYLEKPLAVNALGLDLDDKK